MRGRAPQLLPASRGSCPASPQSGACDPLGALASRVMLLGSRERFSSPRFPLLCSPCPDSFRERAQLNPGQDHLGTSNTPGTGHTHHTGSPLGPSHRNLSLRDEMRALASVARWAGGSSRTPKRCRFDASLGVYGR